MKNRDLDSILKQAKVPEPPQEFWDELPGRVSRRVAQASSLSHKESGESGFRFSLKVAGAFAAACVCVLAALVIFRSADNPQSAETKPDLENTQVLREVLAMFPNQIRAIVHDEHGFRLVLSDKNDVSDTQPVLLKVCDGKKCQTILTFSGQEIQVDGQELTVLSDARGGVLVMGKSFLWSSREPRRAADGLRIQARELEHLVAG